MKKNFTRFLAALALLVFLAPPMVGWGQTRGSVTYVFSDHYSSNTTLDGTAISLDDVITATFNKANGSTAPQYYTNGTAVRWYAKGTLVINASDATISSIVITYTQNSNSVSANVGSYSHPTGTGNGTWTGSASSVTFTQGGTSGHNRISTIAVTYTTSGGSTDPTITLSETGELNIGNYAVGAEISRTFTVSQENLSEDITLTATNGGTLTLSSIDQGEASTEVTWTFTPQSAGQFTSEITAMSGETSATFTYLGYAYEVHNVNIASMEHGTVTANPTSTFYWELVTLDVTPDEGYELDELMVVDADNNPVTLTNNSFHMPDSDVTVSATFVAVGATQWVLTSLADLTTDDVFVIVGDNGDTYAMSNDKGTSSAPAAVEVTVTGNEITSDVAANIQWNISGNATDGYTFYPNGSTTTWLYCNTNANSGSNNNMRVGTGNRKVFELNSNNYLMTKDDKTVRYLSIYNNADWRGYINTDLCPTMSFYKKVTGGVVPPSISAEDVNIAYDATNGSIAYTINNGVEGGSLSATTTSDWLTLGNDFTSSIAFTCSANATATDRTATVTLTYTYGDNQTATKNVTVTQAGNPNYTPTIAEVRAQGTGSVVTKGVVTSCVGITGYIQDATAAICVYGAELTVGDEIRVSGTLTTYKGLLEITSPEVTVISQNNTIEPTVMTIEEINTDYAGNNAWQGWYVTIEDAIVTVIDGQNTTIAQGANTIVVRGISGVEYAVNDILTLDGNIGCYNAAQIANPQNVTVQAAPAEPSITLISNDPTFTPESPYMIEFTHESGGGSSIDQVQCENFSSPLTEDDFSILFCDAEGNELTNQTAPDWILDAPSVTSESNNLYLGVTVDVNQSATARTCYFKVGAANGTVMVYSDLVTVNQAGFVATITVDPTVVNATAAETDGTITVTYTNIDFTNAPEIVFYSDAEGTIEVEASYYADWFQAEINSDNNVDYLIGANDGEARTAYFKVYGLDIYVQDVYSDLVTVNQAEYVVDYAELPFEFDGGRAAIATTNGLTQENLGSDYNSSPKLKFDQGNQNNDDKYSTLVLKINERPGTLTFDIKGNSFSGGTFKVQTSEDGETYTDLETYTELTSTVLDESFDNLGENVRYIKWIYTEKSSGNVALGNITLAKYVEPVLVPSITVDPDMVEVDAAEHDGTLDLTYENLEIADMTDFDIQYYDAEGEETSEPDWVEVLVAEQDPAVGEGYVVSYFMLENEDEARSAYFKVFVEGGEDFVYSNLVTVSQAAPVVPFTGTTYTLATTIESGRHYIITNGSDRAMGGQGNNNRAAVEINTVENVAQVNSDDVVELVINGPDANGFYTIYDANVPGYLYAAGGTSSNHLKTQTFCDNKGQWTISFDAETSAASIMANMSDNNARNTMRYNSNSDIFSCYSGGQQAVYLYLKDEETPQYDFYKDIAGYGSTDGNYYLIASPIDDADPIAAGMITDELGAQATPETSTYDFYWFDQTQADEWRNYRQGTFKLASGMGYLYANKENKTIHFTGTPYDGDGTVSLVQDEEAQLIGWNLVGNPFGVSAYIDRDFYAMNEDGSEIMTDASTGAVEAMQGIFVIAEEDGETLTFTTEAPTAAANVTLNLSQNRGAVIDRAIVRFNEGRQLPKFQLNAGSTKLYIPQGSKDYAVVRSANEGEMPVSFKAAENGTYTLNVEAKNVEVTYLHLIDNRTGADVDLLANPSYTFEANKGDNASRFRLVFKAGTSIEENASTNSFAYFNGSAWVISNTGDATLQVIDMMGRVLSSEQISGNTAVNINETAGIYMLRLVNGENVMVQKVVVR